MKLEQTENYKQGVALALQAIDEGKTELEALDGIADINTRAGIRVTYKRRFLESLSDAARSLDSLIEGKVSVTDSILHLKVVEDSDTDEYDIQKVTNKEYDVLKNGVPTYKLEQKQSNWTCTCPAFKYRGRCRHLSLLQEALPKRHPRAELDALVPEIEEMFSVFGPKYNEDTADGKWAIVGSYRRGKKDFKDIDILVECSRSEFAQVEKILQQDPEYKKVMSGPDIIRGYYHGYEFDVSRVEPGEFASYLLYRTGSAQFNIKMRGLAKSKGMYLNEHGLHDAKTKELVTNESEEAIMKALGMNYVEPKNRE